jgi:hypothetical protein
MAGYLGSKAVLLSTTAATVTGNATISGDLTVDTDTLYVDSTNNRVGVGTVSPAEALEVVGDAQVGSGTDFGVLHLGDTPDQTKIIGRGSAHATLPDTLDFQNASVLAMRIDSSGNVGIGTAAPTNIKGNSTLLEVSAPSGTAESILRGSSAIASWWAGSSAANIGTTSNHAFVFHTNDTEACRINSSGDLLVGTTSTAPHASSTEEGIVIRGDDGTSAHGFMGVSRSTGTVAVFNRNGNDGDVIGIHQAGTTEGSISVSGTTVSYNGGHLARWSRLPDGTDDSNILKGTVMTNLDQMIEWVDENGVAEDNEQLNFTNVSSIEGDPNVAGVFVAWDESDDWGDYYLAMTGDMVIRIGAGVTVQQGDLLMSAGDGTAKPQDDDIVRSKTIAKVISTNKSHEYPDGSYAVPCVLMAC